ncbi:hypothetical protein [Thiohalobacter thiocyanaticus]|uniref:hypothetical protein n=1 Tax=Thiohalobacter thiocyanaticus TaxID=585455 RepID=UPI00131A39BC|nr:hypothetical protein [Thiohalobacter thiocyanaticus]
MAIGNCGFRYRGEDVSITISCGIALFDEGDTVEMVFDRAERGPLPGQGTAPQPLSAGG